MPTSVPNFNFLARLVSEIWGGSQIKSGSSWFSQTPPSGQIFISGASTRNDYKCANFQLFSSINFRDKEGVPKFNAAATSPLPYLVRWNFYVCWKYLARSNSVPNFSIVSSCIMQLCEYVFSICAQKCGFGGFEGEDVKILSSNPRKTLPCVNTRLLMYRLTKSVQRPEL